MIAAIYSRKSKITGKGESTENQVQMCKEYTNKFLDIKEFVIYEDEGFSGKNTDRPEFKRMMNDAKKKKFDVLICYRLDRVSRNIADFSILIEDLQKHGISFVSIKEQFDTSNPMGRAMMNIAAVFAQLERETIAERVRDNMFELAKTGRWLGGAVPYGFEVEKVIEHEKEVTYLKPVKEELDIVKEMFEKFSQLGSLRKVWLWLIDNNIGNKKWAKSTVHFILKSPCYAKSSPELLNYLENQGIAVIGEPNGNGILTYGRRPSGSNRKIAPKENWICCVSKHEGIIESNIWIQVQEKVKQNDKYPRFESSSNSFLTGLLRCGKCGAPLIVNYNISRSDKSVRYYFYTCSKKKELTTRYCDNGNITLEKMHNDVIDYLYNLSANKEALKKALKHEEIKPSNKSKDLNKIKKAISKNDTAILNLTKQLGQVVPEAADYVIAEINRLSKENATLKERAQILEEENQVENTAQINFELFYEQIKNFGKNFDLCETVEEKRRLIRSVVKEISWDSDTGFVDIELLR